MVLELNKFGTNLEKGIKRHNIIYISSALTSVLCGMLTALTGILFSKDLVVWIILDIVGTFLGTKSLVIVLKIINANLTFLKSSNILDDALKVLEKDDDVKELHEATKDKI